MSASIDSPKCFQIITEALAGGSKSIANFKRILKDIFIIAGKRGFTGDEFSLLIKLVSGGRIISVYNKNKLLPMIVPCTTAPATAMKHFMAWFCMNNTSLSQRLSINIIQWLIALIDNNLLDRNVVNVFYFDLFDMLNTKQMIKYLCKLLCELTEPADVTMSLVRVVYSKYESGGDSDDKYLFAVLNLFQGYKPHLVTKIPVKRVNFNEVFKNLPQEMDLFVKLAATRFSNLEKPLRIASMPVNSTLSSYRPTRPAVKHSQYKISYLIPFPTFNTDDMVDKFIVAYPNSIKEAMKSMNFLLLPEDLLSLLRNNVCFVVLMYKGPELQFVFQSKLHCILESVFLTREKEASDDDKEFLLSRIYDLQMFMQQALPIMSTFLAGYLLEWDGEDNRFEILHLIEWVTFNSYKDLWRNILRSLYCIFITYDHLVKLQIIRTCTRLISNMYTVNMVRAEKGLPYLFHCQTPKWISDPIMMIQPLVNYVETLINIGIVLHSENEPFRLEAIHFYKVINTLESDCKLPMWTLLNHNVVGYTIFNTAPASLDQVCKLMLRYCKNFPSRQLDKWPEFYKQFASKIHLLICMCQEICYLTSERQNYEITQQSSSNGGTDSSRTTTEMAFSQITFAIFTQGQNTSCSIHLEHEEFQRLLAIAEKYLNNFSEFIKYMKDTNFIYEMQRRIYKTIV